MAVALQALLVHYPINKTDLSTSCHSRTGFLTWCLVGKSAHCLLKLHLSIDIEAAFLEPYTRFGFPPGSLRNRFSSFKQNDRRIHIMIKLKNIFCFVQNMILLLLKLKTYCSAIDRYYETLNIVFCIFWVLSTRESLVRVYGGEF